LILLAAKRFAFILEILFINAMCILQLALVSGWASFPKIELLRITGAGFCGMDALRIAKPAVSKHQRKSTPNFYVTTTLHSFNGPFPGQHG